MIARKIQLSVIISICFTCFITANVHAGIFTIPSWVTNSCVFIMQGHEPKGTGFLIFINEYDTTFCYLVLAKHVIQSVLSNSNAPLAVRFNLKGKDTAEIINFKTFEFNGKRWAEHTNSAVDLAVMPLSIFDRIKDLDIGFAIVDSPTHDYFATSQWIEKYNVAPGDQVFTLGLVPYLYSKTQMNLVLSRFGNISLLPKKEIVLPGGEQKAYFLACPAFGGNSGGPAFVLIERSEKGQVLIAGWRFALLGVVTEFVPSPLRIKEINLPEEAQKKGLQLIENTGISKVVPADYLTEILFSDSQKNFRKIIAEDVKKREKTEKRENQIP